MKNRGAYVIIYTCELISINYGALENSDCNI